MKETDAISVAISMYDDGYNKGRIDAINEYTNMLIEYNQNHYFDELCIEDLRKMADDLKGKNND